MTEKQKQKRNIHNIIIDADGKCEGMTDFQVGTLDASYHMIEELCVSAHALSIFKEFLAKLPKMERDKVKRLCSKMADMLSEELTQTAFIVTQIMYVNTYSNVFDKGIASMFNQIKMEREGIMYGIQKTKIEQEETGKKPLGKPPDSVEMA